MLLLDINKSLINWIIDFLMLRKQRVKLGTNLSDWSIVNGGVPQGTILGPLLFLVMVNDLVINHNHRWKYVDDTTLSETIDKGNQGNLQSLMDEIFQWCSDNDMQLNHSKCKELIISFANDKPELHTLFLQDYSMSPVLSTKVLGIHLSSDLKWNIHIEHIIAKASKRLYFLRVLKRSRIDPSSLIKVYTICLRPVLEYGCQIWNYNSPDYLKEEIERIQRRALRIICPYLSYNKALTANNIPLLSQRRNELCQTYFKKLLNPKHKLNDLIPQRCKDLRLQNLRNDQHIDTLQCKTSRFYKSFIPSSIVDFNDSL